jgi:hypothetical protein
MKANQVEKDLEGIGCGFMETCFPHPPGQNEENHDISQSRACGAFYIQTRRVRNLSVIVLHLQQPVCYRRPS